MRKRLGIMAICLLTVFSMMIGIMPAVRQDSVFADTVEENNTSRLLNIVYDDSTSMLLGYSLAWCQAKYSLEVFSAMMQDNDSMNVYFMSQFSGMNASQAENVKPMISNLSGDRSQQQSNINKIHNAVTETDGTYFLSIVKAYDDLKANSDNYDEKWLVVITDGDSFSNGEEEDDLNQLFQNSSGDQIKVVYLAIGENALMPTASSTKGIYVYNANAKETTGDEGILSRVTQICERIFQRPPVSKTGSGSFTLDIPASEIIIFAQGKNVEIGEINGAKKTVSSSDMTQNDKDKATINSNMQAAVAITELHGTIVTFTPTSGEYFEEGKYQPGITADEYVVYYKPCLDVFLNVKDSSGKIVTDSYIPEGDYFLEYWLTYPEGHPKHGERIPPVLFDVNYERYAEIDGNRQTLTSDTVSIRTGNIELSVVANYLNYISSVGTVKYIAEDFTIFPVDVELEYIQREYRMSTLEKDNKGILVKVTKDGAPIGTDEWAGYQIEVQCEGLDFRTQKNSDGTFTVFPAYKDGDRKKTKSGDIDFLVDVFSSNDHRKEYEGTANGTVNVFDDVSVVELGVTVEEQDGNFTNKNFNDQPVTRKVTITWQGQPLTKEQYDNLSLSVEVDDSDLSATVEPDPYVEGQPTTATVTFRSEIDDLIKLRGKFDFTVQAKVTTEDGDSLGESEDVLRIEDARTAWEIFMDWLPVILIILLLIFLFLAYSPIIKKYLPRKIVRGGKLRSTYRPYRSVLTLLSVLIPFKNVWTSVPVLRGHDTVRVHIKARGGSSATCTNVKRLNDNGIYIDNQKGKDRVMLRGTTLYYRNQAFARFYPR